MTAGIPTVVAATSVGTTRTRGAVPAPRADAAGAGAVPPPVVTGLLVVTVVCQRVAVPLGGFEVQMTLITSLTALVVLVVRGRVRGDRLRAGLYALGAGACTLAAFLASWSHDPWTLTSWVVLLGLYLPWVFRLRDAVPAGYHSLARSFVRLMLVLAAIGVAQLCSQLAGLWTYSDLLDDWLPDQWLITNYNDSIPLEFGSPVYKSNAFVFLEPSFLSQFCALALLVGLVIGIRAWQVVLLGLGLFSAVSGTGLLLLGVGLVLLVLRLPDVLRPEVVAGGAGVLALVLASPVAGLLLERRDEFGQSGSSAFDRFVAPYLQVAEGLAAEPARYLLGAGPGTATRLLESSARGQVGEDVVYNIPTKLVFEYGLVAGTLFAVFLVVSLLHRGPVPVVPGSILFMIFVLSGSLLQPHTIVLAWLLTGLWSGLDRPPVPPDEPPRGAARSGARAVPAAAHQAGPGGAP